MLIHILEHQSVLRVVVGVYAMVYGIEKKTAIKRNMETKRRKKSNNNIRHRHTHTDTMECHRTAAIYIMEAAKQPATEMAETILKWSRAKKAQ